MLGLTLDEILKDVSQDVVKDENFTKDFKRFTLESTIICKLCEAYEEGTGRLISKNNMMNKIGVISFIKDVKPVLAAMGIKIKMNNKMINKVIEDFYIHLKEINNA
jgi:hypothetical protein